MLTKAGQQVKLINFGLARLTQERGGGGHTTMTIAQLSTPTMTPPLTR